MNLEELTNSILLWENNKIEINNIIKIIFLNHNDFETLIRNFRSLITLISYLYSNKLNKNGKGKYKFNFINFNIIINYDIKILEEKYINCFYKFRFNIKEHKYIINIYQFFLILTIHEKIPQLREIIRTLIENLEIENIDLIDILTLYTSRVFNRLKKIDFDKKRKIKLD